jgi:general secretion pathway protein L
MLAKFFSWWIARLAELLPHGASEAPDGIVVDVGSDQAVTASMRRKGRLEPVNLGAAARLSGRNPILLRPPPSAELVKHHTVPTAPKRQLDQLLRHELARITPFPADDLFWRWDGQPKFGDKSRTDVVLTMVPKQALASAIAALESVGLKPRFVEVGPTNRPRLLAITDGAERSTGLVLFKGLAWACAGLVVIALALPLVRQALALGATDDAIAELRPTIAQVEALRRGLTAEGAGRAVLQRELQRTGDVLQVLATVTRVLPDDTYLTDFALRERQMTISGRSASAPRLITLLSAEPAIRNTAFAAPVTRIEGATADVFSIKAEVAP